MGYKATNFAHAVLASNLSEEGLEFTVGAGTGSRFPVLGEGDWTTVVLQSASYREIIKIVSIVGDTFTAASDGRGWEGTTPKAWTAGAVIGCRPSAGLIQDLYNMIAGQQNAVEVHEAAENPHNQYELKGVNRAKVSATDTTGGHLVNKVLVGDGLITDILQVGGNEKLIVRTRMAPKKVLGRLSAGNGEYEQLDFDKQTIWVPAVAMYPHMAGIGAEAVTAQQSNGVVHKFYAFDAAAGQAVQFAVRMPKSWDKAGITAKVLWSSPAVGGVRWVFSAWQIKLESSTNPSSPVSQGVSSANPEISVLRSSPETGEIVLPDVTDSEAYLVFQLYRDVAHADDTLAVEAHVFGVTLHYHVEALTDA